MWKYKFLTRSVLMLIILAFPLISNAATTETDPPQLIADFDETMPIEEAKICSGAAQNCERITCLDLCLSEGEDPIDCPLYCNIFTENKLVKIEKPRTTSRFLPWRANNSSWHQHSF